MKFAHLLITIILCFGPSCFGQFSDDFADGNYDGWEGDTPNFIINAEHQLQLNAPSGSTTIVVAYAGYLFLIASSGNCISNLISHPLPQSTENIFGCQRNRFSNCFWIFPGGWCSVGDTDPLELKYLNNGIAESVGQSAAGLVALQPAELNVRVIKKNNGQWEIYKLGGIGS
jgi:hypothetical protein